MGWTTGALEGPFSARAAIAFDLGEALSARVLGTARFGTVIYAAVRSEDGKTVFGLVLLAERRGGILATKPITEDMGPAEDGCPERILDLLTEPTNDLAREWRERCRARLARPRPRPGQRVQFAKPLEFSDGRSRAVLVWVGGSRFRDPEVGVICRVPNWRDIDHEVLTEGQD